MDAASSDAGAGGTVQEPGVFSGVAAIFDPSGVFVVRILWRSLDDVGGLFGLSGGSGLEEVVGATQDAFDGLVNELGLVAVGVGGEALAKQIASLFH